MIAPIVHLYTNGFYFVKKSVSQSVEVGFRYELAVEIGTTPGGTYMRIVVVSVTLLIYSAIITLNTRGAVLAT